MPDNLLQIANALADRYRVERELGRGGMATVYLAQDRKHKRLVAIKVLHPEHAAAIGSTRFLREIEIAYMGAVATSDALRADPRHHAVLRRLELPVPEAAI